MITANMQDEIPEDQQLDLNFPLPWCLNAKNALANIHGFSSFQVVFVKIWNSLQHLTAILTDNLIALHKPREAFISSENSDKIHRTLNNIIRPSGDAKYTTVDKVYYKRANDRRWKGPASALGQDGQQVLVIIYVHIPVA